LGTLLADSPCTFTLRKEFVNFTSLQQCCDKGGVVVHCMF